MTIDQMLDDARAQIDRMYVFQLTEAFHRGAIFVDIRPQAQRAIEGTLPGALAIERNVLEWRLDPTSSAHLALATDHDVEWVIVCSEGLHLESGRSVVAAVGSAQGQPISWAGTRRSRAAGLLGALSGVRSLLPRVGGGFGSLRYLLCAFINRGRLIKAHSGSGGTSSGSFRDDG